MSAIVRHRTALHRTDLSRSIKLALEDGLITELKDVFDYGCGRGGDLRRLREMGFRVSGWDPAYAPTAPRDPAHIVNIGYVINVIEDRDERAHALQSAWALTKEALVVAGRLEAETRPIQGRPLNDGILTTANTFQKLYQQEELRIWIEQVLGVAPISAGPGVFYVFRDDQARESFLASRVTRNVVWRREFYADLFKQHEPQLSQIVQFMLEHGRKPTREEIQNPGLLVDLFRTVERAIEVAFRAIPLDDYQAARKRRVEDLLVYLALGKFSRRPTRSSLPDNLLRDIQAMFTSYRAACELADTMLFSLGEIAYVRSLCNASKVGKETPSALYVHVSALDDLPVGLRLYEGAARTFIGRIEGATLVKLHRDKFCVSYLAYPHFEKEAHPQLAGAVTVHLRSLRAEWRQFNGGDNPPILHRKEEFVSKSHPDWNKWHRLTKAEERAGLYRDPSAIGRTDGWQYALKALSLEVRGHRLKAVNRP